MSAERRRNGFTLVELLVVITIIGILVALLLPAVQAARESARATRCRNNLKQLGLAVLAYETKWGMLPPASQWFKTNDMNVQNNGQFGSNWVIAVLPFVEQEALYNKFDLNQSIAAAVNREARGVQLSIMLCTNDAEFNRTKYSGTTAGQTTNHSDNWARGNYGANVGPGYHSSTCHCGLDQGCAGKLDDWQRRTDPGVTKTIRGVMGPNLGSAIAKIEDGTSNTAMLFEIRAGVVPIDCRGVWAMGGAGPSAVAACGYLGDSRGPNNRQASADDIAACAEIQAAVGGQASLAIMGMGCYAETSSCPNRQCAPRSMHPGGVFCCLCDGSVRWISNFIDLTGSGGQFSIWDRLLLSQDRLPLPPDAF